jgi:bleomycin hydrolase
VTPLTTAKRGGYIGQKPIQSFIQRTDFFGSHETRLPKAENRVNILNLVLLPVFYDALKGALRAGFSADIDLDTSEPSYETTGRYCFIPDFDIPSAQITQAARELRFLNGATSDDHAIHLIGCTSVAGEDLFLAKDSWKVAWRDGNQGSLFLHSSYVKLKVLAFLVHRDAVPQVTALLPPN